MVEKPSRNGGGRRPVPPRPVVPPVVPPVKPKVPCDCACTASVVGPAELYMGDADITWSLRAAAGGQGSLAIILVGSAPDAHTLEQQYVVDVRAECRGGGAVPQWQANWTVVESGPDHVGLQVSVTGETTCPDGSSGTTTCSGALTVQLRSHCGPDITVQFIAALNRILQRLRDFAPALIADKLNPVGNPVRTAFLLSNGPWMIFRPYNTSYWRPNGCPSCRRCSDTVTLFGQCIDCFIPDALIYGVVAGFVGLSMTDMDAAGLFTKWMNDHLNSDTVGVAMPTWELGHEIGSRAWDDGDYTVTTSDEYLHRLVATSPKRGDCLSCSETVPIRGPDWSSMDWSPKKWLPGTQPEYVYDPPAPPPPGSVGY